MIAACYRRDEAQNPELFADALALVLADYPASVVHVAVDPRTGVVTRFPMGLPNIGQIKEFLDDLLMRQGRLEHYASLPKPQRRVMPDKAPRTANLFVPSDSPRYEKLVERHQRDADRGSYFETRVCHDGVRRDGLWVPLDWWEEPQVQKQEYRSDGPVAVSEHLKALLRRQLGEADDGSAGA